ncbi:MAG: DUF2303 family protein [Solirubrobacteraceae bacterium]
MSEQIEAEAEAIIRITREAEAGALRPLDPIDAPLVSVTIPHGYSRETIDLSAHLTVPQRATGKATLQTVADFSNYVERHNDLDATTVWVDIDSGRIVGVLNDHQHIDAGMAGWGDHRAALTLKATEEWLHWTMADKLLMPQELFAEHIEDGLKEIIEPAGNEMLDVVTSMQGHTKAEWKSAKRLQDGSVQFLFNEEATATAGGSGELEIPQTFKLAISPFLGEEPFAVTARLRYRVSGGNLTIGYKLDRPDHVKRLAIDDIATRLSTRFDGRVFIGIPRS